MSYARLYDEVQLLSPKVKTRFLRDRVTAICNFGPILEVWSGELTEDTLRGAFVMGPLGRPLNIPLGGAAIVLARAQNKCWRRFVYTKELMHVFDTVEERADTPEKFDHQLFGLDDPTNGVSPQLIAENKAFWRALGVLCPENARQQFVRSLADGDMRQYDVALRLKIPEAYIAHLVRPNFLQIMDIMKR